MALLRRRRAKSDESNGGPRALADDAPRMRAALMAMAAERGRLKLDSGETDLRALVEDLLNGEAAAPTRDGAWLGEQHPETVGLFEQGSAARSAGLGGAPPARRARGLAVPAR